jgi:hypothetical protein
MEKNRKISSAKLEPNLGRCFELRKDIVTTLFLLSVDSAKLPSKGCSMERAEGRRVSLYSGEA